MKVCEGIGQYGRICEGIRGYRRVSGMGGHVKGMGRVCKGLYGYGRGLLSPFSPPLSLLSAQVYKSSLLVEFSLPSSVSPVCYFPPPPLRPCLVSACMKSSRSGVCDPFYSFPSCYSSVINCRHTIKLP